MKSLIYYYSWKDKIKPVADALQELTGAELRRIEEIITGSGLMRNLMFRIRWLYGLGNSLRPFNPDMNYYDRIFVGTPIWAGKPAPAINAFINEAPIKGKKVIIFCAYSSIEPLGALKKLETRIKGRSGRVTGSFSVRTNRRNMARLPDAVREAAKKYI